MADYDLALSELKFGNYTSRKPQRNQGTGRSRGAAEKSVTVGGILASES